MNKKVPVWLVALIVLAMFGVAGTMLYRFWNASDLPPGAIRLEDAPKLRSVKPGPAAAH